MGNMRVVDEPDWGVYLWIMPNGQVVSADESHPLMLEGERGDRAAMQKMRDFVRSEFGITEGQTVFLGGHRNVSDEEWEEQRSRLLFGLEPDPVAMMRNNARSNRR
jgi:hypothetical protein